MGDCGNRLSLSLKLCDRAASRRGTICTRADLGVFVVYTCRISVAQDVDVQRVMLRLSEEYPGDLGILMPLMLNLLQLKPGMSFFMTVDEPHAYLRGDILEVFTHVVKRKPNLCNHFRIGSLSTEACLCSIILLSRSGAPVRVSAVTALISLTISETQVMACSNNVVRAALTPKFRDVNLLVEMLTYNMGAPAVLPAEAVDSYRKRYTPPIDDFEIQVLQVRYWYAALTISANTRYLIVSALWSDIHTTVCTVVN